MKWLTVFVLSLIVIVPLLADDPASVNPETAWPPKARLALSQLHEGRFVEAAASATEALQIARHFGPLDKRLASNYHLLGSIYRDWGHCGEARANYSRAVAIFRKLADPNPHLLFNALLSLINTMDECEDFAAGEKTYRANTREMQLGVRDSLDQAKLLAMRGALARGRKHYRAAEALFRESIGVMEKAPTSTPLDILVERSNLGVVLYEEGRNEEALDESEKAAAFFEKTAPHNPSYLASLNNAACALAQMGRKDDSGRMFQRALTVAAEFYGEDNRGTARIMLNYARILRETHQSPAAVQWEKKGAEAMHQSLVRDSAIVDAEELRAIGK